MSEEQTTPTTTFRLVKEGETNAPEKETTPATETPETPDTPDTSTAPPEVEEYDADKVVSFFKSRGREVSSIDELLTVPEPTVIEKEVELPDNVKAYHQYHKETGRSVEDWVRLNQDFGQMSKEDVLVLHLSMLHPSLSIHDVREEIEDKYGYDPDLTEERVQKSKDRAKQIAYDAALNALNESKQKYAAPLASRELVVSDDEKAEIEAYRQSKQATAAETQRQSELYKAFTDDSSKVLNGEFKGFDIKIGDKDFVFNPDSGPNLFKKQGNINEVLNEVVYDADGKVKDAKDYHMRLAAFRDPIAFAKHFYEQGKADQVVEVEKDSKNLNIDRNGTPPSTNKSGTTYRVVDDGSSQRLTVKGPVK